MYSEFEHLFKPVEYQFGMLVMVSCFEVIGKIIQVRKKCGQFGSDVILLRTKEGELRSFENVACMQPKTAEVQAKYDFKLHEKETTETAYTIFGKYPEIGFIIDKPKQPVSESPAFSITTNKCGKQETTLHKFIS